MSLDAEDRTTAVGLFNYAHSYAVSAVELAKLAVEVSHWNAPVNFLYFHAIELYLKSFLLAQGKTNNELRDEYGHNVRKLSEKSKEYGLELTEKDEEVFALMADTDNVISSRYIRMGTHSRLPLTVYNDLCKSLHIQIEHTAYRDVETARRPVIWW